MMQINIYQKGSLCGIYVYLIILPLKNILKGYTKCEDHISFTFVLSYNLSKINLNKNHLNFKANDPNLFKIVPSSSPCKSLIIFIIIHSSHISHLLCSVICILAI